MKTKKQLIEELEKTQRLLEATDQARKNAEWARDRMGKMTTQHECIKCAADIARELRQVKFEIEELTRSGQQDPSRVQIAAMILAGAQPSVLFIGDHVKHALAVADALLEAAKTNEN